MSENVIIMKCWKNRFDEKTLKNGIKFKDKIADIAFKGNTFKACVKNRYDVELVIEDNILYGMSCSCSKKTGCGHEAGLLYFLDEFPEILEDFNEKNASTRICEINLDHSLEIISPAKAVKFLSHEFKNDSRLKYRFMKYFEEESLIDEKEYRAKLKYILKHGREPGFRNHGHYNIKKIGNEIKKFLLDDIEILICEKEYGLAYELLDEIIGIFIDQRYWDIPVWYGIMDCCTQYCYTLSRQDVLSESQRKKMKRYREDIDYMVYKLRR